MSTDLRSRYWKIINEEVKHSVSEIEFMKTQLARTAVAGSSSIVRHSADDPSVEIDRGRERAKETFETTTGVTTARKFGEITSETLQIRTDGWQKTFPVVPHKSTTTVATSETTLLQAGSGPEQLINQN